MTRLPGALWLSRHSAYAHHRTTTGRRVKAYLCLWLMSVWPVCDAHVLRTAPAFWLSNGCLLAVIFAQNGHFPAASTIQPGNRRTVAVYCVCTCVLPSLPYTAQTLTARTVHRH